MIVIIDNYDSFAYNLYQGFGVLDPELEVFRNDRVTIPELRRLDPDHIVISPGPKDPDHAGVSVDVVRELGGSIPILGVCLGHQSIAQAFGGKVVRADRVMHGKTSQVFHDDRGLFRGVPNPFVAARYHSLTVAPGSVPHCLEVSARTEDGVIMGLRHRTLPIEGVQFHPESFMTLDGPLLLKNFLGLHANPDPPSRKEGSSVVYEGTGV